MSGGDDPRGSPSPLDRTISYCGWTGRQNLGDEAILEANRQLFSGFDLRSRERGRHAATLVGGGTVLPVALKGWSDYYLEPNPHTFAIGVGIADPVFQNYPRGPIDLRRYAGVHGVDVRAVLDSLGSLGDAIVSVNHLLGGPLTLQDFYLSEADYRRIGEFGFDAIGVRGPDSREILARYGVDASVVGDTALHLEPTEPRYEKTGRIGVCLKASGRKWQPDRTYVDELVSFCNGLSDEYEFVLTPFYPADYDLHRSLLDRIDNASLVDWSRDPPLQAVLDEIAGFDLVIGEKLHACVLSACCSVPFVSIEYDPKHADFTRSIDMDRYRVRIDRVSEPRLRELFFSIREDSTLVSRLEANVAERRTSLREFAADIEARLEG